MSFRRALLAHIPDPVVLETHGGRGAIYDRCYRSVPVGMVIEKDPKKTAVLVRQRPDWGVFEGEAEKALRAGLGAHLPINFVDVDPYGDPWPAISGFLGSDRPRPPIVGLAVNDGLRQVLLLGKAWQLDELAPWVERFGSLGVSYNYLTVVQELLAQKAAVAGYAVDRFHGVYVSKLITHYAAVLTRVGA